MSARSRRAGGRAARTVETASDRWIRTRDTAALSRNGRGPGIGL